MKSQLLVKPNNRRTTAISIMAALAVSAVITYSVLRLRPVTSSPSIASSPSKPLINTVAALGYLEPQGEVIKLSAPAFAEGARVEQLLVKRGDRVKVGQTVAILDSRERLQAALQQAQVHVRAAQARLAQVKAGAKTGDILTQDAKFQQSKAELVGQINTQQATIAGLEAQLQGEKSAQKSTIERIAAESRNADTDCLRYQSLYQDGAISIQSRDTTCLKAETNRKLLEEANANIWRIVSSRREQIQAAKANLQRTVTTQQKQIQAAKATLLAVAEVRPVDVQVAQADLATAQAAVQKAKADLALAYVRAPKNSQILKIHSWPGEMVSAQGIVELGQTSQMYVTAEVYETDISRVRVGQQATIQTHEFIGDLKGTVDEIGLQIGKKDVLGNDPVADTDARVVEVKIRLDAKDNQKVKGLTNLQVNTIINTSF
jgi:HlyD family secretion protein